MVYLDNAATSFPKPEEVYVEMDAFMRNTCANPGRSSHEMARESAAVVMRARENIAKLFNIENPLRIGFTCNATMALNIAIHGVLKKGDHVITTAMDHNSVLRPLYELKRKGIIDYTVLMPRNQFGAIEPSSFTRAVRTNTKLIATTLSSNVTGMVLPYKEIGEIAKRRGILYLLDCSQGAGVLPVDVKNMYISLLAFPGHKGLMGPQGTGGLYVNEAVSLRPIIQGGTGSRSSETVQPDFMPDIIESGTLNTPGIAGLNAGVEFILKTGTDNIYKKKKSLIERLYEGLAVNKRIRLYSTIEGYLNSGIIALLLEGMDSSEVANILDSKYHIAVRPGFHCAPLAHKALGTDKTGLVRLSPGYFNTHDEIQYVIKCINEITRQR
ncbi:MAG TPA: aminotransferase class V-fold PLP-dependent enzyme [Clostridiaceae bacterium]|nr:aminotransferase class V-fold PLP-dependent enzyme [Clostridiaceae bacterium]